MINLRKVILFSVAFLLLTGFVVLVWQSPISKAQTKPLSFPEVFTALNTKLPNKSFKDKTELVNWLIGEIKKRKVDKSLTKDREDDLKQVGASTELIETIRQNSPPLPKLTAQPTPVMTPKSTPTATPTPVPEKVVPVKMEFIKIPSGSFEMGSDQYNRSDEQPVHKVKIKGFEIQKTEVTQKQWLDVMKVFPKDCEMLGNNKPVMCIGWDDIQEFLRQMNSKSDGYRYRLPTEAEWEYAARAGVSKEFIKDEDLDAVAWYEANSMGTIHDVAKKRPNAWGLYDMLGNASEWTNDWYDETFYSQTPDSNPTGPKTGKLKVLRGGSWYQPKDETRYAFRFRATPSTQFVYMGFRLVREK